MQTDNVKPLVDLEVEGELTLTHADLQELYTIFTDDRYDSKGIALQGKHLIKVAKPIYLLDAEVYHPMTKGQVAELTAAYTAYVAILKHRVSWARFWDNLGKLCMVLWLLLVILFLIRFN